MRTVIRLAFKRGTEIYTKLGTFTNCAFTGRTNDANKVAKQLYQNCLTSEKEQVVGYVLETGNVCLLKPATIQVHKIEW
jgi:hypothetical protein